MCKVPSPEEIKRTKQLIPTDKLVRWAEESGFLVKSRPNSSHLKYKHIVYPDLTGNFIIGTTKLGSQHSFADLLFEVQKRNLQTQKTFDTAAGSKILEAYKSLPPHLTVEHDFQNGWSVVRDKHLPQVGVTIKFEDTRLFENKIRFLEDNKRDAYILLNRHGITLKPAQKNSPERVLSHPVYEIPAVILHPYVADTPTTSFFGDIGIFAQTVGEKDMEHEERLAALLAHSFIESVNVTSPSARGTRQNTIVCRTPSDSSIVIAFTSHSNRRLHSDDNVTEGQISAKSLAALESRINGLAAAHLRAA